MVSESNDVGIKIVNFGLAAILEEGVTLNEKFGSLDYYMAPEVIRRIPYGKPIDMWSFGVILYVLICGSTSPLLFMSF